MSKFLDTIYSISDSRRAIDIILDHLDGLLNSDDFEECNNVLQQVNVGKLSDSMLVSFLGITRAAQDNLSMRSVFYNKVYSEIATRRGIDGANRLLKKYR